MQSPRSVRAAAPVPKVAVDVSRRRREPASDDEEKSSKRPRGMMGLRQAPEFSGGKKPPDEPHGVPKDREAGGRSSAWADGLLDYVRHPERHREDIVDSGPTFIVIKDKYPKARFHYLVIANEKIDGPSDVNATHIPLLEAMRLKGQELADRSSNMSFRSGFHALPSMRQLHMHVISEDFDSEWLKTKKHWNSFTSPFFLSVDRVIEELRENGRLRLDKATYEEKLRLPLRCHVCSVEPGTMPALKAHLASALHGHRRVSNSTVSGTAS